MKCCVLSCKNYSDRCGEYKESITFHVLPRDEELKKKWISIINRANWNPTKHTKICSAHFHEHDFTVSKRGHKMLRKGILPYLKLGHGTHVGAAIKSPQPSSDVSWDTNISPNHLKAEILQLRSNAKRDRLKIRSLQMQVLRLRKKTSDQASERTEGNLVCSKCSADIKQDEDHGQEKENAMLARVYQYFAEESPTLSRAQLRQRTALCTGATQAAVQRALGLTLPTKRPDECPGPTHQPPHKRQKKQELKNFIEVDAQFVKQEPTESDASGERHTDVDDERESVFVKIEPAESDGNGEDDPLDTDVDIKPDVTDTVIQNSPQQ